MVRDDYEGEWSGDEEDEEEEDEQEERDRRRIRAIDYMENPCNIFDHILHFFIGFLVGFTVLFIFYKIILLSLIGGLAAGTVNLFLGEQKARRKRLRQLRIQFYDMLESMSVAMRAGNPVLKALESARKDLSLIYSDYSDIIIEIDLLLYRFHNGVRLSKGFSDFAERCRLEDVASFASIYATIEGKSERANEIVRETQQIISDKMSIEMEIDTLMTAAKSEVNIMLVMPLIILLVIGYAGAGFMDAIYTERVGRLVATGGLIIFIISYFMAQKFSDVAV